MVVELGASEGGVAEAELPELIGARRAGATGSIDVLCSEMDSELRCWAAGPSASLRRSIIGAAEVNGAPRPCRGAADATSRITMGVPAAVGAVGVGEAGIGEAGDWLDAELPLTGSGLRCTPVAPGSGRTGRC